MAMKGQFLPEFCTGISFRALPPARLKSGNLVDPLSCIACAISAPG